MGRRLAGAKQAVDFQNLLGLGESEADGAVVPGVNEIIGLERVDGVAAVGLALLLEAEDDAGRDDLVFRVRRHDRVQAERRVFQQACGWPQCICSARCGSRPG